MSSRQIYVKDNHEVAVSHKFVYHSSVYRVWKSGAGLLDDKYYVSNSPLNLKKIPTVIKKKKYSIRRFFELEAAPEEYLITKGYKKKLL